eukprot:TRINITY_DN1733_c1_g1_i3.p1 TRINITY_DN1733_c1_g1~~TRINITY_DN1733_c1_g1_i3.p1  ORF type:complete len:963 (+),score=207.37 TRINITY_DN1733_c1_g1_i3:87-2975(+)
MSQIPYIPQLQAAQPLLELLLLHKLAIFCQMESKILQMFTMKIPKCSRRSCPTTSTLTTLQNDIVAWHKLVELGRFRGHTAPPTVLCAVGASVLISAAGSEVLVWPLSEVGLEPAADEAVAGAGRDQVLSPQGKLALDRDAFGDCTAICHLPTYLHKVLVAGSRGGLELWNVRTRERIHWFKNHVSGEGSDFAITCLREAPNVLDVLAIGFASGRIIIFNAREDKVLLEFEQAQGRVTCLAFRTGPNAPAHLVSGAPNGSLVVWDLDKRRAHHVMDDAHQGPVTGAHFLLGQPVLFTGGHDNAVREWIFDTADGLPRLLRFRSGCPGPARKMFFYTKDDDRQLIVAGGADGSGFVARVSCTASHQNVAFSQANLKKLPGSVKGLKYADGARLSPVIDMAFCEVRHYDWPAVVTAHEGTECAFVWSANNLALAPVMLRPESAKDCAPVSAVAISKCGNYCVLGLENGGLHRFNLQSQLHRGAIPRQATTEKVGLDGIGEGSSKGSARNSAPSRRAHLGRICGVDITASGLVVSTSSHPEDCALRLWKLTTHEALEPVLLGPGGSAKGPSPILLRAHGSLVAISLSDGTLCIVDLPGRCVVRSFACGLPATDVAFSSEGRWLAAALRGGGLRVFDLPASRCVDSFAFARPALSVCFSPTTTFLLTSHAKGNAIQMWANKFLFDPDLSAPLLRPESSEPIRIDEPGAASDAESDEDEQEEDAAKVKVIGSGGKTDAAASDASAEVVPLEKDMLTLSGAPPGKWLGILHLDTIKERNKPAEPPKPLPNAPFFLPTSSEGITARFAALDTPGDAEGEADATAAIGGSSRVLRQERAPLGSGGSVFQRLLVKGDFDGALAVLKKQTPSGVHLALEELGPMAGGDLNELAAGMEFFMHHLQRAHYADELQVYLSLFLQFHGEDLSEASDLRESCARLGRLQEKRWISLDEQCQKVKCFLGMMTQTQSQW